jgi:hypothetical protein
MGIHMITVLYCPLCHRAIDQAISTTRSDKSSPFWGEPGKRFLICREGAHYHIEVETAERVLQRYAYVIPNSLPGRDPHEQL